MNFGLYASPERNLLFDINDFDETLPGPWEWDVKRLTVSFAVSARAHNFRDRDAKDAAWLSSAVPIAGMPANIARCRCSTPGIPKSTRLRR